MSFFDDRHILLSKVLIKRHGNYVTFVQAIHDIIFRVHVAAEALRKAQVTVTPALNGSAARWVPHVLPEFQHGTSPCALEVKVQVLSCRYPPWDHVV